MTLAWTPGADLATGGAGGPAFARWLRSGAAAAETAAALAGAAVPGRAPLFTADEGESWRQAAAQAADPVEAAGLAALSAGRADAVVTGQQPGFLGGPVLTLLKAATAVALARLRTEQGHPAVTVFWCADDDEDLIEALAPVGWDEASGAVRADGWAAARAGALPRGMIGPTSARSWCGPGAALLAAAAAARPGDG
ncbi:bacillithiol biosynthesis BshC, partial [bacterium]|nr:bacillithiol biosynthesis BshC [bacterium]